MEGRAPHGTRALAPHGPRAGRSGGQGATTGLTRKQQLFVAEYLVDLNATRAAIRAGYSEETARAIGCENLTKPAIASAIETAFAERAAQTGITAERVIQELARVALFDIRKLYNDDGSLKPVTQLDDDTAAAIAGIDAEELFEGRGDDRGRVGYLRKVRHWDKNAALVTLAKHLGLLRDRLEVTGKDGQPVGVVMVIPDNGRGDRSAG